MGGIQIFFNFSWNFEGHRKIGNKYLLIGQECAKLEALYFDGIFDLKQAGNKKIISHRQLNVHKTQRTSHNLWEKRTINDYTNFNLLIEQMISGCNEAWSYFLKKYGHFIYICINRIIKGYSFNVHEDNEDCFQEVLQLLIADNYRMLKMRKRYNFNDERFFRSWLWSIATRRTLRLFRCVRELSPLSEEVLADDSIFQKIQRIEIIDLIIKKLSNQESIIILYLLNGFTLKEISQFLNLNLSKVYNIKKKAFYKLKKTI